MARIIVIFYLVLSLFSCYPEDKIKCLGSKDYGKTTLVDSSSVYFNIYAGKKSVFFRDSMAREIKFDLNFQSGFRANEIHYAPPCENDIQVSHFEEKEVFFSSADNSIDFKITFNTSVAVSGTNQVDELNCELKNSLRNLYVLEKTYIYTKHIDYKLAQKEGVTILGNAYHNVIRDKEKPQSRCYINKQIGILAFRDFDNKLWVFDRFE